MKLVEIKHYFKNSMRRLPAFVLLMSDGKEYISHGCQFVENTPQNREMLVDEYDCQRELDELLEAQGIGTDEIDDCRHMLHGCTSLERVGDFPAADDCSYMLYGCTSLERVGDFPAAVYCLHMLHGCTKLMKVGDVSEAVRNEVSKIIKCGK